jgi:hypothetical protein
MMYCPNPYPLINAAKLMDNDLFEMGFAQLRGYSISVVAGDMWHEYYFGQERD